MQEDFIHYLWKHKRFNYNNIKTTAKESVSIVSVGTHNYNSGPDFFAAQLKIGGQLWAGNVEIHVKSSDWFVHNHEQDANYDNVILHIVWEHDVEVHRKDSTLIPTVELKDYVKKEALNNYKELFNRTQSWINCENNFATVDEFVVSNWLERLYLERLERKTATVYQLLEDSKNDWEAVLFKSLARNFGLKVNGDSFFSIASSFDFSIVRKLQSKPMAIEALFLGQANLLEDTIEDPYFVLLKKEFKFLKQKFNFSNRGITPVQFFRLRPMNFPTIRLSQLAILYHKITNLFSRVIEAQTLDEFYAIFNIEASLFWETHYTFSKESKPTKKKLSKGFIDLLLINTIIPIKYSYAKAQGKVIDEVLTDLMNEIASEKNNIITKFNSLKPVSKSALQSQALIQLKTEYCDKNSCLKCAIGTTILN